MHFPLFTSQSNHHRPLNKGLCIWPVLLLLDFYLPFFSFGCIHESTLNVQCFMNLSQQFIRLIFSFDILFASAKYTGRFIRMYAFIVMLWGILVF